jgi:hypothetical protein
MSGHVYITTAVANTATYYHTMLTLNRISNSEQLAFLMESVASSHVFMDTQQTYEATRLVVESLRLEEVNAVATEICEHITLYGQPGAPQPSAVVACVPSKSSQGGAQVCIVKHLTLHLLCVISLCMRIVDIVSDV